jgi:Raf kinase inhibitor-like YbhB/YbcL family protein
MAVKRCRSIRGVVILGLLCAVHALSAQGVAAAVVMTLASPAFEAGGPIPSDYTCEGKNISPPLVWNDVPPGTKSLALIIDDPDAPDPKAPQRVWVHWVLYNIPADATGLADNAAASGLPKGTARGVNDSKKAAYNGPCPPIGRHRYVHKLYALDTTLDLAQATKVELEAAMKGHELAQAQLIGTYQKGDR